MANKNHTQTIRNSMNDFVGTSDLPDLVERLAALTGASHGISVAALNKLAREGEVTVIVTISPGPNAPKEPVHGTKGLGVMADI